MNSIHEQFNYAKNYITQVVSNENSVIRSVVKKTVEIGTNVLIRTTPHVINMSPYYLSRMINLKAISMMSPWIAGHQWLYDDVSGVAFIIYIISFLDLISVFPAEKEYRVAVDSLLLLTSLIGSSHAIYKGTKRMIFSWSSKEIRTTVKISLFISGAVLTTIGAVSFGYSLNQTFLWVSGFKKLQNLDPEQMKAVFKHRAITEQSKNFECTAVIIDDGISMDMILHRSTFPFAEELYRNCRTRSYVANSDDEFCTVLKDARKYFGNSVDILSLQGHANNKLQQLGDNYFFTGNPKEITCMEDILSSDAQIGLIGCNTATITPDVQTTLLDRISEKLPGKTVTGFKGFYSRFFTTTSWMKNRFSHENYYPYDLNGIVYPKTSVVKITT